MSLADIEAELGFEIPEAHRRCLDDLSDPVHDACDFLVVESEHELLRLIDVHRFLHSERNPAPWPVHLVAFASNGCGDYFAYDLRRTPPTVVYIDPDSTVAENLEKGDLVYPSFEAWRSAKVQAKRA